MGASLPLVSEAGAMIAVPIVLIYIGMPFGIGILSVSFGGVMLIRNDAVALRKVGKVANDSLEEYLFAVVPLFVLMGLLVTVSDVGEDTFDVFQRLLRRITAGLGMPTPPFGLPIHTIKAAIDDPDLRVAHIVRGARPFVGAMLLGLVIIAPFPTIATWLARQQGQCHRRRRQAKRLSASSVAPPAGTRFGAGGRISICSPNFGFVTAC